MVEDGPRRGIGVKVMKRKKRWTEKQIKEKIKEIENSIRYQERAINRAEEEIADLNILLGYFKAKLVKKHSNPSSKDFGDDST